MPRKRQSSIDKLIRNVGTNMNDKDTLDTMLKELLDSGDVVISEDKKMSRPKKIKGGEQFADATVTPVANGYVVTSSTTGKNMFVFENIDKAFDFIRTSLKPTIEQAEFLTKV